MAESDRGCATLTARRGSSDRDAAQGVAVAGCRHSTRANQGSIYGNGCAFSAAAGIAEPGEMAKAAEFMNFIEYIRTAYRASLEKRAPSLLGR